MGVVEEEAALVEQLVELAEPVGAEELLQIIFNTMEEPEVLHRVSPVVLVGTIQGFQREPGEAEVPVVLGAIGAVGLAGLVGHHWPQA